MDKEDNMDNLKELRARAGLKQETVAAALGVKQNTVSNWETGTSEPDIDTLRKLCRILNCTAAEILGMEPIKTKDENGNDNKEDKQDGQDGI